MGEIVVSGGLIEAYDRGLPRPEPPKGMCERCQIAEAVVAGRFCQKCHTFLEVRHQYERDHRAYLNEFCKNVEEAAKAKHGRERLAPPANPIRTVEVEARPAIEIKALPSGDGEEA